MNYIYVYIYFFNIRRTKYYKMREARIAVLANQNKKPDAFELIRLASIKTNWVELKPREKYSGRDSGEVINATK